jgi:hypothetical protein
MNDTITVLNIRAQNRKICTHLRRHGIKHQPRNNRSACPCPIVNSGAVTDSGDDRVILEPRQRLRQAGTLTILSRWRPDEHDRANPPARPSGMRQ